MPADSAFTSCHVQWQVQLCQPLYNTSWSIINVLTFGTVLWHTCSEVNQTNYKRTFTDIYTEIQTDIAHVNPDMRYMSKCRKTTEASLLWLSTVHIHVYRHSVWDTNTTSRDCELKVVWRWNDWPWWPPGQLGQAADTVVAGEDVVSTVLPVFSICLLTAAVSVQRHGKRTWSRVEPCSKNIAMLPCGYVLTKSDLPVMLPLMLPTRLYTHLSTLTHTSGIGESLALDLWSLGRGFNSHQDKAA